LDDHAVTYRRGLTRISEELHDKQLRYSTSLSGPSAGSQVINSKSKRSLSKHGSHANNINWLLLSAQNDKATRQDKTLASSNQKIDIENFPLATHSSTSSTKEVFHI
jgi:hypothetical protein